MLGAGTAGAEGGDGVAWSIVEVSRLAKVTSRTLRHYDEIGLLTPAYVGGNGYRFYEREQLLALQQILLLRELGLGLPAIGEVLAGQTDRVEALRRHRRELLAERDRLDRLAATVARTLTALTTGDDMAAQELFDGFAEQRDRLEADLAAEHGEGVREHFRTAKERTEGWTQADYLDAQQRAEQLEDRVLALLRAGAAPNSASTLDVMAEHYAEICRFWTPDRDSYPGLGRLYVDDPGFRARYDAKDPGLAEYLRDATAAYAEQRL